MFNYYAAELVHQARAVQDYPMASKILETPSLELYRTRFDLLLAQQDLYANLPPSHKPILLRREGVVPNQSIPNKVHARAVVAITPVPAVAL